MKIKIYKLEEVKKIKKKHLEDVPANENMQFGRCVNQKMQARGSENKKHLEGVPENQNMQSGGCK